MPFFIMNCHEFVGNRIVATLNCVRVVFCVVSGMTYSSDGGAIYCALGSSNVFVSGCTFAQCQATGKNGGAIYCTGANSNTSILKTCFFECYAVYGQAVESRQTGFSYKYANDTSVSKCPPSRQNVQYSFWYLNNYIYVRGFNSSNNENTIYVPAIEMRIASSAFLLYSTISNNFGDACVSSVEGTHTKYERLNVVNNKYSTNHNYGIFYCYQKCDFYDSVFLNNQLPLLSNHFTVTLSNCKMDALTYYNLQPVLINGSITSGSHVTYVLNHLNTFLCGGNIINVATDKMSMRYQKSFIYITLYLLQFI